MTNGYNYKNATLNQMRIPVLITRSLITQVYVKDDVFVAVLLLVTVNFTL